MMLLNLPDPVRAREAWWQAQPFPHVVVPDVIYPDEASACAAEFPAPDSGSWHTFTGQLEEGKQEASAETAGPNVYALHCALAGDRFVQWLRAVSAVPDLMADPDRHGGGIHQSGPGARLGLHTDFNVHPLRGMVRAVNVIVFVGDGLRPWRSEWGGMLELGGDRAVGVRPDAGLLIAFEASDRSFHGHPTPMTADAPLRKSVPAYYYRPIRDGEDVEAHSTRFLAHA